MSEKLLSINQALAERFDGRMTEFAGEITLIFSPEKILDAARAIHDEFKFDLLSAVHRWITGRKKILVFMFVTGLRPLLSAFF